MSTAELILLSVGLAMDAFAVSICKGLNMKTVQYKNALIIGLFFGGFQALMPAVGYLLGKTFEKLITSFDHWVAFILLAAIGAEMIIGALKKEEAEKKPASNGGEKLKIGELFVLAVATSIDALAVGISLAIYGADLGKSVLFIGLITFAISFAGVCIGNRVGVRFKEKAEIAGGVILILIGTKILLEDLGILTVKLF